MASLSVPDFAFLFSTHRRQVGLFNHQLTASGRFRKNGVVSNIRIRAVREESVVIEEREKEVLKQVNGSNGYGVSVNVVDSYGNGNGSSLAKYVNGNGSGNGVVSEVVVETTEEDARKRNVEEIGKEEAWFKRAGQQQVEVYYIFWEILFVCLFC